MATDQTSTKSSSFLRKIVVRDAADGDMPEIHAIYSRHVLFGLATFEEVPPSIDELMARRTTILERGLPYLAATVDGQIVGYSYASIYNTRSAYRYTIEDSIYVADGLGGRGIGGALLQTLITRCEIGPWRRMLAIIGDSANAASIALHRSQNFHSVGTLTAVGFKFGRWVDTVLMQRPLDDGTVASTEDYCVRD